ncbi:hypothetical protein R5R35_001915 [Gryllus longicercus]|uniref:Sugar phosphate exchanger 3 n=1 Tax=Gryllus longicercus TaxID=2509291 RepID=A0AAN9VQT3_9ORTH
MMKETYQPSQNADIPCGISVIQKLSKRCPSTESRRVTWYRVSILALTYIAYTCYHLSRKPISVVKNVLHQNCSEVPRSGIKIEENSCSWAPFDGKDYTTLLGTLDSAFLFAYAAGMFISGMVAERVSLRYFLAFGMILSGIFSYLFGIARNYNIHTLWYFIIVQILGGFVQTTGWPGVVTVVGNWFGEGNRGLIFGIWNSHTSVGNILGSLIAGEFVETDWGLSFIVPGVVIALGGFLVFLFLIPHPSIVGITPASSDEEQAWERNGYRRLDTSVPIDASSDSGDELDDPVSYHQEFGRTEILADERTPITSVNTEKAISFWRALKIPGVAEFSMSLFFAKLVSYTFLYWLPQYIKQSTSYSATVSAELSTLFDVGGIIGGIAAGLIRDFLGMSATTCAGMLTLAVPMLLIYDEYAHVSKGLNIFLLIIVGILVNGPYSLITTAVSAELGTSKTLKDNSKALATVTAIIDGTGSIGAAVGPLLAGIVTNIGWEYVFYMLMIADVAALLCLFRLVSGELRRYRDAPLSRNYQVST